MGLEDLRVKMKEDKNSEIETLQKDELNTFDEMMDMIDSNKPSEERILDIMMKSKNPYAFVVDGTIVKINYSSKNAERLSDILPVVISNEYMNRRKK